MSLWGEYLEDLLDVSFNGVSFQSVSGGQVTDHNFDDMPEIRSSQAAVSSSHRSVTSGQRFISKRAWINIAVEGEDLHNLQSILARFRQLVQYRNKDLVLTRGVPVLNAGVYEHDETRQITFHSANVIGADMNHTLGKGTVITVEFLIDDPVGVSATKQTLLNATGVTAQSTSINLASTDLQGTFLEQYPIFTIKFNSVTNGNNPTVEIENGLNTLTVSSSFTAGDVLEIDTDEMKVRLNGELVDFSGGIPFIADPKSVIYIRDTLTARNVDRKAEIYPRYI